MHSRAESHVCRSPEAGATATSLRAGLSEQQDLHTLACSLMCQALEEPEPGWSKAAPGHHVEANARPGFTQVATLVNVKGTASLMLFQRGDEGINREGCHGLVACRSTHSQLYRDARHSLRVRSLQHSDEVVFPK